MAAKRSMCSLSLCAGHGVQAVSEDHVPFSEPCFITGNDVLFVFYYFVFLASLCLYVYKFCTLSMSV